MTAAEALIARWKREAEQAAGRKARPWKSGDRVRDRDGQISYLVAPDPVRDDCSYWYASDDANLAVIDRFVDVSTAVLLPEGPIREPSIECEKAWIENHTLTLEQWVALEYPSVRPADASDDYRAHVAKCESIAEMKSGGLDAVAKHLAELLQNYGVCGEDRDAIIAQVEKGKDRTRETSSLYATVRGVLAWQQQDTQDRRVHLQITGHVLTVHATVLPSLATRRVKFCTPTNEHAAAIILADACQSGADLAVSRDGDRLKVERMSDPDLFC